MTKFAVMTEYSKFEDILNEQGTLVYTNTGDSMMPLLREHKDLLIIKKKPEGRMHRLDVPLYKRDNGGYILHRILWVRKNDYLICGDNRRSMEQGITDRHILGILDAVVRDGKTIPLRSTPEHPDVPWRYRMYVHCWCNYVFVRAIFCYFINRLKGIKRYVQGKL